jgi:putative ATPase
MACLPDSLRGRRYYRPRDRGAEGQLEERLEAARRVRERAASDKVDP